YSDTLQNCENTSKVKEGQFRVYEVTLFNKSQGNMLLGSGHIPTSCLTNSPGNNPAFAGTLFLKGANRRHEPQVSGDGDRHSRPNCRERSRRSGRRGVAPSFRDVNRPWSIRGTGSATHTDGVGCLPSTDAAGRRCRGRVPGHVVGVHQERAVDQEWI